MDASRATPPQAGDLLHAERLWPSPATWLLVPLFAALVAAASGPFGGLVALVGAAAAAVVTAVALVRAATPVEVSAAGGLRAGRARVPVRHLDGGLAARGERARALRGPELDARTHLVLRGWVGPVALVHLDDPADPTPSWLVSTRRPEDLLAAVARARREVGIDDPPAAEEAGGGREGAGRAAGPDAAP